LEKVEKDKKSARVSIMGLELRVKTDTDSNYVEEIARFVERRVRDASTEPAPPTVGVALLAAMNIADELRKLRNESEAAESAQATRNRRIQGLLKRVEEALDA
jgi:cell division protein ZapA (FtsZ GTPase activity inhibitor)